MGVDDGAGVRQNFLALVVVGDDHVQTQRTGMGHFVQVGDAAVHGDDEGHATLRQGVDGLRIQGVPLSDAVGHIGDDAAALAAQVVSEQTGGGDAIHIIVAIDADGFSCGQSALDPLHRLRHPLHGHGVMETGDSAAQKFLGLRSLVKAAGGQDEGGEGRDAGGFQFRSGVWVTGGQSPVLKFHVCRFLNDVNPPAVDAHPIRKDVK